MKDLFVKLCNPRAICQPNGGGVDTVSCLITANQFFQNKDFVNAVEFYQRAYAMDPQNGRVCNSLAAAYEGMGDLSRAGEIFEKVISLNPNSAEPYFQLARVLLHQGRQVGDEEKIKRAIELLAHALVRDPSLTPAHKLLENLLTIYGTPNVRLDVYEYLLNARPDVFDYGPLRLRIEASAACNLRCQHCPTGTSYARQNKEIMSLTTFEVVVRQIQQLPLVFNAFLYLGGEPLLNKHLPAMCQRLHNETIIESVQFTTNAMLVTEEICIALREAKVEKIIISIDGHSPEENDLIRRGAEYRTIVKNAHLLKESLGEVTKFLISNIVIKRPGDPENPSIPDFLQQDFPSFPITTEYAMKWPGLDIGASGLKELTLSASRPDDFCVMPFTNMSVKANGDVVMCCYDLLGEEVMGNIYNSDLLSIWRSDRYRQLRKDVLAKNREALPGICQRCKRYTGETIIMKTFKPNTGH